MSAGAVITCSANGDVGLDAAIGILRSGGTAIDACIVAAAAVEANPTDHTVGYSGLPNMLGEVELDASVMEGRGLRAGSVGGLRGYQDVTELARRVMETLPHVLISGDGGSRLAEELGFTPKDLLTPEAEAIWRSRLDDTADRDATYMSRVSELVAKNASDADFASIGEIPHGTVNFIARDRHGDIACAVSTSGWAWKYPGRLGDSPVIGAGNYADNRWGAAACTGRGEMAQRCLTAHSVVTFMRFGMSLDDALGQAMRDLDHLDDPYRSEMNIVAMDRDGNPGAASSAAEKSYLVYHEDMAAFETRPRMHVPLEGV